ncbi:hypothetical protein GUJ93_ZPchr0013g36283 [Zizania palustris]|uniref:Uncharacterized protein n=1 Tax=Zizania palustris TaxID=103762 RepID=A0A8J6BXR2_ZIZPA|nr:hypothetical protein GUJ93_ZPchr0013g36283 [Zizania palustris]
MLCFCGIRLHHIGSLRCPGALTVGVVAKNAMPITAVKEPEKSCCNVSYVTAPIMLGSGKPTPLAVARPHRLLASTRHGPTRPANSGQLEIHRPASHSTKKPRSRRDGLGWMCVAATCSTHRPNPGTAEPAARRVPNPRAGRPIATRTICSRGSQVRDSERGAHREAPVRHRSSFPPTRSAAASSSRLADLQQHPRPAQSQIAHVLPAETSNRSHVDSTCAPADQKNSPFFPQPIDKIAGSRGYVLRVLLVLPLFLRPSARGLYGRRLAGVDRRRRTNSSSLCDTSTQQFRLRCPERPLPTQATTVVDLW